MRLVISMPSLPDHPDQNRAPRHQYILCISIQRPLDGLPLALLGLPLLQAVSENGSRSRQIGNPYQSLFGAVKSMSVVAAELGIAALQRRVSRSLGLLGAARLSVASVGTVAGRGFD